MKLYTIVEQDIPIGFFMEEKDRDEAFNKFYLPQKRWGIKSTIDI